jgi:glycosyltransferase involved in cell wall biosynthesis
MKIAQIAPLWERVPPPAYGGIELVVGLLTDELVARGHEVKMFAHAKNQPYVSYFQRSTRRPTGTQSCCHGLQQRRCQCSSQSEIGVTLRLSGRCRAALWGRANDLRL